MAEEEATGYKPPAGYVEDKKDSLIELDMSDSKELWLIQWPINQPAEFVGKKVKLKLDGDGHLGTFEDSSGKSYEVVSCRSDGPSPMVFLTSSSSEAKIAGKISRHVSLIHYPEPSELQARNNLTFGQSQRSSGATSTLSGRRLPAPTRSVKPRNGYSTPSSKSKSSGSGSGERSKTSSKRKHTSTGDSSKGSSGVTSIESKDHSGERKSKKKRKTES